MEAATIIGVYDYIGYRLCQYMLDRGIEITGVHFDKKQENENTEEKRLEIGRNANFQEISFWDWDAENGKGVLFISLLERYQISSELIDLNLIMKKLDQIAEGNMRIILILPGYLAESGKLQSDFGDYLTRKNFAGLEFFVPTIYGPSQPESYFFQQSINYLQDEGSIPVLADWEWCDDAIYIDDAVSFIFERAEGRTQGKFFLTSGKSNQWLNCAELLLGERFEEIICKKRIKAEIEKDIEIITLKKNEEITSGLTKQKEQFYRMREDRAKLNKMNDFANRDYSE